MKGKGQRGGKKIRKERRIDREEGERGRERVRDRMERRGDGKPWYTDKKEKKIFLIYKEIQMGAVAKSNMRKCANVSHI